MRTRRSWRNQDRLYQAIGRDLARAAAHARHQEAPRMTYTVIVTVTTSEDKYDPGTARALVNNLSMAHEAETVWDVDELQIEKVHIATPDGLFAVEV